VKLPCGVVDASKDAGERGRVSRVDAAGDFAKEIVMAIPLKDSLLVPYSQNWATRTTATPTDFGLTAAQAEAYVAVQSLYVDAYTTMMNARADGTWSESQTALKNATKATLLEFNRQLYAFVQANLNVSDANKILLGVDVRNFTPSPTPAPDTRPTTSIDEVFARTINGSVFDPASKSKRAKAPGALYANLYCYIGATYPSDPAQWQFEGPTSRSKFSITLPDTVPGGSQVWVCAAWVNRRGESGPVSMPVSAYIQGGGVTAPNAVRIAA